MVISEQNIEKLKKLSQRFVEAMGEEYFVKLLEAYELLHNTLFNKEYVEDLTEEKLTDFINENKSILKFFDYFNYVALKTLVNDRNNSRWDYLAFLKKLKALLSYWDSFNKNISQIKELENKISSHKGGETIFEIGKTDPNFYDFALDILENFGQPSLINFKYPKFNDYRDILKSFDFSSDYELSKNDISFLEGIFSSQEEYLKKIPVGVVFYHFCKWYSEEYIERIEIDNYFSIKEIKLNNLDSKEIYFLGENGVGKTILLQAILKALKGKLNSVAEDVFYENISFQRNMNILKYQILFKAEPKNNKTIYAYGVNRNAVASSDKFSENEYSTLFSSEVELLDPITWLQRLYTFDLEIKTGKKSIYDRVSLDTAKEFLSNLFEENISIEVDGDKVTFTEKETTPLEFRQLSDGYKSVLIWVSDLIQRMSKEQPNVLKLQDFRGVVLIDELDLFLHPKWAYKIMEKLRGWFPKVQFIISTHSPVLVLGASKDAIFYKVYKENGETKVSEPVSGISNLMANSVITSPLFDLPQAYSRAFEKSKETLRLGDDFISDKIHDFVSNEIKKHNNVEEKDIMDLIREKYNEI